MTKAPQLKYNLKAGLFMNYVSSLFFLFFHLSIFSECIIDGAVDLHDPLFVMLTKENSCPKDVFEFSAILEKQSLTIHPAMVANRGRHNPSLGSFSFFEEVRGTNAHLTKSIDRGEFFFGHFTALHKGVIDFNQTPSVDNLLIEALAWDEHKGVYNFYELIGLGENSRWFYRGDSIDALKDNRYLFLDAPRPEEKFGDRMRCSACHLSGGPIMKELSAPHNDWWTSSRPLSFGQNRASAKLSRHLTRVMDASDFSASVKIGMDRLEHSASYRSQKATRTLAEQLRPLFCTTEINIVSDLMPHSLAAPTLSLPSAYFMSPWLGAFDFILKRSFYEDHLKNYRMRFPETYLNDADHGWLSLVKGHSDYLAINSLLEDGVIDVNFVKAVLAIDFKNPTISIERCQLLSLVPAYNSRDWRILFLENLKASSQPAAQKLFEYLRTTADYEAMVEEYKIELKEALHNKTSSKKIFEKLLRDREIIKKTDVVKNPLGQILEPGFRVIFPVSRVE